jgi:hypothetical protein
MQITFENPSPFIWENPGLRITGCEPLTPVIVDIENYKREVHCHKGQAVYQSDENGVVDPGVQQSVFGSYFGVDPIGLYWSMAVLNVPSDDDWNVDYTTHFTAAGQHDTASASIVRKVLSKDVSVTPVQIEGAVAEYFLPRNPKHGHVITFGGSDGGITFGRRFAQFLSSNGYPCVAIAYFGFEGIAPILSRIPLEIVGNCISFIKKQPGYDGHIGICGISRGGEHSLLASCCHPEITATLSHTPSDVAWGGMLFEMDKASWTFKGEEIPWIACDITFENAVVGPDKLFLTTPGFRRLIRDQAAAARAQMPLERIAGDVLLISGDNDNVWCADEFCRRAVQRFKEKGFKNRVVHLAYENHGHETFTIGLLPTTQTAYKAMGITGCMGGDPKANAHATHATRRAMLEFLEQAFSNKKGVIP